MATNHQATLTPTISFHPDRMVTLLVRPEKQEIVAHGDHLSRDSVWFKALLREGRSRIINLEKELPDSVQYYIENVVHGGRLPTHNVTAGPFCTIGELHYPLLARLYVLGERLLNAKYQNLVIQEIFRLSQLRCGPDRIQVFPSSPAVKLIYQGTTPDSPARRLMVDLAVHYSDETWFDAGNDHEYSVDCNKALMQVKNAQKRDRDFRLVPLKVEDYLVCEHPLPQSFPGV
jgi:hypothetical protein